MRSEWNDVGFALWRWLRVAAPILLFAAGGTALAADAIPDIGGMAPLDKKHFDVKGKAVYLIASDIKTKPKNDDENRLHVLTVRKKSKGDGALRVEGVELEGLAAAEKPNDLEALCALPGRQGSFLAAESGYFDGRFGRVFWIDLKRVEDDWIASVRNVLALPKDVSHVEGMACLPRDETSLLLVFGERGGGGSVPIGRLRWGVVEIDKDGGFARDGETFKAERLRELLVWPVGQRVGKANATRDISDLYFDEAGQLWGAGAIDRGNRGPFRSVVYLIGRFRNDGVEFLSGGPKIYARIDGIKVEALSAGPDAARFGIGADGEDFGGLWRPLR